jgi:hypothetical protein
VVLLPIAPSFPGDIGSTLSFTACAIVSIDINARKQQIKSALEILPNFFMYSPGFNVLEILTHFKAVNPPFFLS